MKNGWKYLRRLHQHLPCADNYGLPNLGGSILQGIFLALGIVCHPGRCYQSLHQTGRLSQHQWLLHSQAVCRQLEHHISPKHHHRLCPSSRCSRPQLCPGTCSLHSPASRAKNLLVFPMAGTLQKVMKNVTCIFYLFLLLTPGKKNCRRIWKGTAVLTCCNTVLRRQYRNF